MYSGASRWNSRCSDWVTCSMDVVVPWSLEQSSSGYTLHWPCCYRPLQFSGLRCRLSYPRGDFRSYGTFQAVTWTQLLGECHLSRLCLILLQIPKGSVRAERACTLLQLLTGWIEGGSPYLIQHGAGFWLIWCTSIWRLGFKLFCILWDRLCLLAASCFISVLSSVIRHMSATHRH